MWILQIIQKRNEILLRIIDGVIAFYNNSSIKLLQNLAINPFWTLGNQQPFQTERLFFHRKNDHFEIL